MRVRVSTRELCYCLSEFRSLSCAEICRRYNWGDWLDSYVNEQADKEAENGLAV